VYACLNPKACDYVVRAAAAPSPVTGQGSTCSTPCLHHACVICLVHMQGRTQALTAYQAGLRADPQAYVSAQYWAIMCELLAQQHKHSLPLSASGLACRCTRGFEGQFCAACSTGYGSSGKYKCIKCFNS
jgi:hypothetical protein